MARRTPQAPARNLVAALDVGSSKVCALIAEPDEEGKLRILGTGQRESRGVKRGFIADMEKSEIAIREAVEQAERIAGTQVDQVFVGLGDQGADLGRADVERGHQILDRQSGRPTPHQIVLDRSCGGWPGSGVAPAGGTIAPGSREMRT